MSKILALTAYRASPHNNFFAILARSATTLATSGFGLGGQSIRGAGREETAPARQGACASFNLAAEKLLQLQ